MQKFLPKRLAGAALFLMSTGLMVSCEKDVRKRDRTETTTTTTTTPTTTSTSGTTSGTTTTGTTGTTTSTTPLYTKTVNWNNYADGVYGYTQAVQDFQTVPFWGGDNIRSQVSGGRLRTTLTKDALGGTGGVISRVDVLDASEYSLSFDMMFDPNFDFSWGGKVGFGFLIGNGYTGGTPGWDGEGASFRLMWYKNTSTSPVILKPYVYYKDQPGTYGNDFGKVYPSGGASIQKGQWYNVKMYMKANTGSNTDGRVQMVINGTTVIDQAIRWTTNDLKRTVNNICFETFRGGAETYWQSSTDGNIYFDNVSWSALAP
jgi:hypothetical protein